MPEIDWADDIIDLRQVTERLAELEADDERDDDEDSELALLQTFKSEFESDTGSDLEGYAEDEPTLIADRYFITYAQELADDVAPSHEARELAETWPYRCIDWEWAARELKYDYSSVTWNDRTYWVRSI